MNLGLRREARLLASESSAWVLVIAYSVLLTYGAVQGVTSYQGEQAQIAKTRTEYDLRWKALEENAYAPQEAVWGSWRSASLAGSEQGGAVAWFNAAPLGALNRGYAARQSPVRRISLFDSPITPPLSNPVNLMYGWMDFGFAVLWLLPLVQLLLAYQSLGRDRELGLWPLILASGVPLNRLAAVRLAIPSVIVIGITIALGTVSVGVTSGDFDVSFLAWSMAVCTYSAFWTLTGGVIGLSSGSAARQLLVLGGIWITAVWVGPGILDAVAELLVPRVSLADGLLAARDAQLATSQRAAALMKKVYEEHPNWQPPPDLVFRMNQPVPGGPRRRDSR